MIDLSYISGLATLLVLFLLWFLNRKRIKKNFFQVIKVSSLIVLFGGYIVHLEGYTDFLGLAHSSQDIHEALAYRRSFIASIFMPLISTIKMFIFDTELELLNHGVKANDVYMSFYAFFYVSAMFITSIFIVNSFGARIRSYLKLKKIFLQNDLIGTVHVFFNINDSSLQLAKNIRTKKPDDVLIFVDTPLKDEQEQFSIGQLFNIFSFRKEILENTEELDAILIRSNFSISSFKGEDKKLLRNLKRINKLIKVVRKTKFYFLSDDNAKNLLNTIKLRKALDVTENICHCTIYCMGEYEGSARLFMQQVAGKTEISIIDKNFLAAFSLRTMQRELNGFTYLPAFPINYVDINTENATVKTPFNAMIVGFSSVGRYVLDFLYEYGQFVYDKDVEGDFHCTIVDKDLVLKAGKFNMQTPAFQKEENKNKISFEEMDINSEKFWRMVISQIDTLNYVVITIGDDQKGMKLATDLYDAATKYRKNKHKNFTIFVCSYQKENQEIMQIISESTGNNEEKRPIINVFGTYEDLFDLNFINEDDKYTKEAAWFYAACQSEGIDNIANLSIDKALEKWNERHKNSITSREAYMNNMRKEEQDVAKAYHMYTKMRLVSMATQEGRDRIVKALKGKTNEERMKNTFFNNLAILEHKRWLASHEIKGFELMEDEDFKKGIYQAKAITLARKHNCLMPYKQLPEKFKHMHYAVVSASFDISFSYMEQIISKQKKTNFFSLMLM